MMHEGVKANKSRTILNHLAEAWRCWYCPPQPCVTLSNPVSPSPDLSSHSSSLSSSCTPRAGTYPAPVSLPAHHRPQEKRAKGGETGGERGGGGGTVENRGGGAWKTGGDKGERGQRSAQRGGSIAHNAAQQAKAGRGTQSNSPAHDSTQHTSAVEQSKVVYHNNSGGQPHHPPRAPTPAQHPTPRGGARPTTRALHPHTATAAHKQGTHVEHHQEPKTPHPNANTAPTTHATTKATLTHNIEGMLP